MSIRSACKPIALLALGLPLLAARAIPPNQAQGPVAQAQRVFDPRAKVADQLEHSIAKAAKKNRRVLLVFGNDADAQSTELVKGLKERAIGRLLLYEFVTLYVDLSASADGHGLDLAKTHGVDANALPQVVVLGADGKSIGKSDTQGWMKDGAFDADSAKQSLASWQAAPQDAEQVLAKALETAEKNNKRVLIHLGAPW